MRSFPNEDKPPTLCEHYVMGLRHRKTILDALPPGGRMLEWGSGDSTLWFRENMDADQTLVSVENDLAWSELTGAQCYGGPAGRNATIGEEAVTERTFEYVWVGPWINARKQCGVEPGDKQFGYDVILVDGVWRTVCVLAAAYMLKHQGTVFLHDSERDWYAAGILLYPNRTEHGSCPDYEGPELLEMSFR